MNPEIANSIQTNNFATNYHDQGSGHSVLLIHGSGPGVTAWANWRLVIPELAQSLRVIAPDMKGFGYTERSASDEYNMDTWIEHAIALLDALEIKSAHVVGNSFGGALALALAIRYPKRVNRLVLMGSVGVPFNITQGLNKVWGYQPSIENMKHLMDLFAYDRSLVTDELAELRYQASIRPGFQESFSKMFPAPRQQWVDAMASDLEDIRTIDHETLIVHGRDDKIIPSGNSLALSQLIQNSQLHIYGKCGHWTQIEHADRFNILVSNFLSEE